MWAAAIDIAKIDRSVPLYALGKIGDDEHGRYVISKLQKYGIDTGSPFRLKAPPASAML